MFVSVFARDRRMRVPSRDAIESRMRTLFPHQLISSGPRVTDATSGLTIDAWLRLDNRDEIASALRVDVPFNDVAERFLADAELVLQAYLAWGRECVDRLEGDFAFVITDPRDNSAFVARDSLGVRPVYYALADDGLVVSPSAAVFDLFDDVDTSIRSEWIVDYIHGISGDWRATPMAGVRRLPPGHWLYVTADEAMEQRYHEFTAESTWEDTRDPSWLEEYRTELLRAVSVRTEPRGLIGVETSGGIDSSTILGVMAHTFPDRIPDIHTFGFAMAAREPEYILETSAAHGIGANHIFTSPTGGSEAMRQAWEVIGYPTEHPNSVYHTPFYSLAHSLGIETLHSGHGGDETVTNAGGLAIQELLARGQWRQAMRDLPGPVVLRPARLAKHLRRQTGEVSHLTAPMMDRLTYTPVRAEVVADLDIAGRVFASSKYSAPFERINDFLLGDRVSAMTSIRTADCSLVAAGYGVDYRWPLFDRRLIAQYLRTPAVWKYGEGFGRYLHRRAIVGMVPDKVTWKSSKDMGAARGSWLRQRSTDAHLRSDRSESLPTAEEVLDHLNPQVGSSIDPVRLRTLLEIAQGSEGTPARAANKYLRAMHTVSDWLNDKDAK